jgi:D-arginine dehydrogenase
MSRHDILIIGAGIGGAALAHALLARAPGLSLAVLEAESQPGYHTTGRSAAFYAETYGGPSVQPLTTASRHFFECPPPGFADTAIVSPRGALHLRHANQPGSLRLLEAEFRHGGVAHQRLGREGILRLVPALRPEWTETAIWEPGCSDIDVAGLHQAYLRASKRGGAILATDARATAIGRSGGVWQVDTPAGRFEAATLVNAAGAWADEVAGLAGVAPIGLQPLRRTIVVTEVRPEAPADLPVVMDAGGSLYFKPDAGRLWISPHDETPDVPHDVQPDEMDMAVALDRFEQMCDWPIRRLASKWAGLRTFAPDRLPVLGPDPGEPSFHWCAGQGGWGIQTAPAASAIGASMILGEAPFEPYSAIATDIYRADRFPLGSTRAG